MAAPAASAADLTDFAEYQAIMARAHELEAKLSKSVLGASIKKVKGGRVGKGGKKTKTKTTKPKKDGKKKKAAPAAASVMTIPAFKSLVTPM